MTRTLARTKDWLIAIDNTLKDEAEARTLHDQSHLENIQKERADYENLFLEQTPNNLSDVANLLIAISEMIDRGDRPNLSAAVSAIGQRINREAPLVA